MNTREKKSRKLGIKGRRNKAHVFFNTHFTDTTGKWEELKMSEFKVIETQEQLDAVLGDRLRREREASEKKYEAFTSPEDLQALKDSYEHQISEMQAEAKKALEEKDAQIAEGQKYKTDLEKTRICLKAGLHVEYADRLRGESADEWQKDAELLAKDFATAHQVAPLGSNEPQMTETHTAKQTFKEWVEETL